jgi:phosphoribosylglycinamide formyltransferase 2
VLNAWEYAMSGMRGDRKKVIVEEFIKFDGEITLLTIKQKEGVTLFCEPIGHYQERGDYQWSWQPYTTGLESIDLKVQAQKMAKIITDDLGGAGLFGVEFFIKGNEVIFSELSPRPHDTGMVTLLTQNTNEFELHLKAIMGWPITHYNLQYKTGASAVVLSQSDAGEPVYSGIENALNIFGSSLRVFGKPACRKNKRMAVVLNERLESAKLAASMIKVTGKDEPF